MSNMSNISNITTMSESELSAYEAKLIKQGNQSFPALYNSIKISYSDQRPEMLGKYVRTKAGDTEPTLIGDSFEGVVLAKRHQYVFFDKDNKENNMQTEQFEEWNDLVQVKIGSSVKTIKGIAKWIKDNYPKKTPKEATYQSVIYILFEGEVYLFRIKGTHCSSWFEYTDSLTGRLTFANVTKFSHERDKKGMVTFYPAKFEAGTKIEGEEYKKMLGKSYEIDQMITTLYNNLNPNATVEEKEKGTAEIEFTEVFGK